MKQASPIQGSGGQWCSLSSDLKKEWHEKTTTPRITENSRAKALIRPRQSVLESWLQPAQTL